MPIISQAEEWNKPKYCSSFPFTLNSGQSILETAVIDQWQVTLSTGQRLVPCAGNFDRTHNYCFILQKDKSACHKNENN